MLRIYLKNEFYALLLSGVVLSGCGSNVTPNLPIENNQSSSFSEISIEEEEILNRLNVNQQKLLDAINKERSQTHTCGERGIFPPVPPLTWNSHLYESALEHVYDLAYSDTFAHDGSGTEYDITGEGKPSKFYERIVAHGYSHYYSVGENIAGGQRNLEEVMKAWMKSPGHCENIMKNTYIQVGIAIVIKEDSTYQVYWGQNFGSKRI